MAAPSLDLAQAPPIGVPLRFFLTAPAFALLAALLALWAGPELYQSRWTPGALAATHLVALGCVTMVMVGALMQILPVLAGAPLARPRLVAAVVHPTLSLGTLALAGAFLRAQPALFVVAVVLLGLAFAVLLAAVLRALAGMRGAANTAVPMLRLAAGALAVAVVLGAWLALARGAAVALPAGVASMHPAWGLFGWIGLLVAAVARRVVPMFQMTPEYPARPMRALGGAIVAALLAWSAAAASGARLGILIAALALAAIAIAIAVVTLQLQQRRRRRVFDVNVWFWRTGMVCAVLAALAWLAVTMLPLPPALALAVGALALVGVAVSLVDGMLYRIVPFLAWHHLYTRAGASPYVPTLKGYIGERTQRVQFALHVGAVVLLTSAAASPQPLVRAGALALAASALLWLVNLAAAVRIYRRHAAALRTGAGAPAIPRSVLA